MVLVLKTSLATGVRMRGLLKRLRVYDDSFVLEKEKNFIFLPVKKKLSKEYREQVLAFDPKAIVEERPLKKSKRTTSFRRALQDIIPKELYDRVARSYEHIGSIGIIEVFPEVASYEKEIAQCLLDTNKGITTVLKKRKQHSGALRLPSFEWLAGEKTTKTLHKENGVLLELDISRVYFSSRTSEERKRIASLVKNGERVLVLFSGSAPFPVVIARNAHPGEVVGVELNPVAHEYALKNVRRNKVKNVKCLLGDVRNVLPTLEGCFDRVLLPHPSEADAFLELALSKVCTRAVLHLYHFSREEKVALVEGKIRAAAKKQGCVVKKMTCNKGARIAKDVYRFVLDIVVQKK